MELEPVYREIAIDTTKPALVRFAQAMLFAHASVKRYVTFAPVTQWGRGVSVTVMIEFPSQHHLNKFSQTMGGNMISCVTPAKIRINQMKQEKHE